MYADPKKVKLRRIKRRLKAGASILLATAAGAFIACQRLASGGGGPAEPSPMGPDARSGPEPAEPVDIPPVSSGASDEDLDASLPPRADSEKNRDAAVDIDEHRKGMPVRDNLLE